MQFKNKISLASRTISVIMLWGVVLSTFSIGNLPSAFAQEAETTTSAHILSDGQFVYGPNIGDFNVRTYLENNASHLVQYAEDIYQRSEYFSINPKIYLTLLEIHSNLIITPDVSLLEDPLGLGNGDLNAQIEYLSNIMTEAFYQHLYTYTLLPISEHRLEPFVTASGITIQPTPDTNAGTYAIMAGLVAMDENNITLILDNSQANGFYQTYTRLFESDDPLDETNQLKIPTEVGALAAPESLLQLPYLQGLSWKFGGVHDTTGCSGLGGSALNNCQFTDASSMDFYPIGSTWGIDTSSMWVVAAAAGIPTRYSDCGYKVSHSGALNTGWETTYYHLEGAKYLSGTINQNDKIGVIANTLAEATCTGGAASGPHVHFSLKYNGGYVAINGTALSGWYVHTGRYSYDTDPNYMWLERAGEKKYPYNNVVLSEAPPAPPSVSSIVRSGTNPAITPSVNFTVTFSESVTGVDMTGPDYSDFSLSTTGVSSAAISGISGSGSVYTVTVNTGTGDGTIRLDIPNTATIADLTSTPLTGLPFTTGQTYTILKSYPTVTEIVTPNARPNFSTNIDFVVKFSEVVSGVDIADFQILSTGLINTNITNVSGSGDTYAISVNTGTGKGTIRLNLLDNDTILDASLNPLGGSGTNNGNFFPSGYYPVVTRSASSAVGSAAKNSDPSLKNKIPAVTEKITTNSIGVEITESSNSTLVDKQPAEFAPSQLEDPVTVASVMVNTSPPTAPKRRSPAKNAILSTSPTFHWTRVSDGRLYHFEYDNNADLSSPSFIANTHNNYYSPPKMRTGTYYWHVRAQDADGNWSSWSPVYKVSITAKTSKFNQIKLK